MLKSCLQNPVYTALKTNSIFSCKIVRKQGFETFDLYKLGSCIVEIFKRKMLTSIKRVQHGRRLALHEVKEEGYVERRGRRGGSVQVRFLLEAGIETRTPVLKPRRAQKL